ncbi:hypothetical protein RRG08_066539 [Elysia crispata]|uniref:Uncharacterized protein n=1 Tax=Elysia crispata TaxID=231223 RepID=A0AAE1DIG6_9GAST|nr:hypothetical protein RRG08_066539 [Elysia crispata]
MMSYILPSIRPRPGLWFFGNREHRSAADRKCRSNEWETNRQTLSAQLQVEGGGGASWEKETSARAVDRPDWRGYCSAAELLVELEDMECGGEGRGWSDKGHCPLGVRLAANCSESRENMMLGDRKVKGEGSGAM